MSEIPLKRSLLHTHVTRRKFASVWGASRRSGRATAILLAVLVAASGCGGGEELASDENGEGAQELGQLQEATGAQESGEAQESAERPVAPLWPHCADYEALREAIARADSAEPAVQDAKDALEEAGAAYRAADAAGDDVGRFDADQSRLNALIALADAEAALADTIREYDSAADAAVASAEALVTDTTAESDARSAGQRAIEALAAATDATLFAVYGQTSVGLGTPAYNAAYEVALAAALGEAGTGRVTAEARVVAAERAVTEARILAEAAPSKLEAAWEAAAAAATAEAEAEAAAYADAEGAAAAARVEADMQAAVVEAIASISAAVGDADDDREDVAYQAAWEDAYHEAEDDVTYYEEHAAGWIAPMAARDAAYAAQAALVVRLDALAERAGLVVDITAAHQAAMSDWVAAWALAEDADWVRRLELTSFYQQYEEEFDRAVERVFDRQPAYDDVAYRAAARAVRNAVADSVTSSESVAASKAEDAHWAVGGAAHRAFVAARDRIASARAGQRGRIHPGTDLIAWDAYHVALDLLESGALAEAADIRADAALRTVIDIETDPRVVEARAAVERSEAAVTESQAAVDRAQEAVWEAESELADAQSALEATRPPYDRAVRAAWKAVATEAGCR